MRLTERPEWLRTLVRLSIPGIALLGAAPAAHAADVTLGIIGPHEYDLPVDFQPFNVLVQYGDGNAAGSYYNGSGQRTAGQGSHTWSGLTKYVHFRSFEAIPHVGFAFEIIQAESFTLANGKNYGGLGPTIVGPAAWFKPNAHSTFGFQTFMQTPVGTRDATSPNYWSNISSFIFDYEWKHFSFDGDVGTVVGSTKHIRGQNSYFPGVVFYSNLRWSWKATKLLEPFFALDWQNVTGTYNNTHRTYVKDSSSREVALGVGMMFNIAKNFSFTTRYTHSVEGRNTPESNAYYIKLVYLW
ncbi:transporter [Gluconacetobacter tumulicola]|uniref:Transporter n=1 Tax=Gluconacetobacter tumulicola TaxID=1017177 RepID=A0A7W4JEB0_9PROT|nr:transporter [Gluconacetobacter tumulicola]MBB2179693.1 transporter [Gluconacetobacter tumulicola]